jgi:hypothetical protein
MTPRLLAFLATVAASAALLAGGIWRGEILKTLVNGALLCLSCIGVG